MAARDPIDERLRHRDPPIAAPMFVEYHHRGSRSWFVATPAALEQGRAGWRLLLGDPDELAGGW